MLLACGLFARADDVQQARLNSFEDVWKTLRDGYWDPTMGGRNWNTIHKKYLRKIRNARDEEEFEELLDRLIHELPSSHLAIIPASFYKSSEDTHGGGKAGQSVERHGSTGLSVTAIDRVVAVEAVEVGSAAADAGVRPGWIVDSVAGTNLNKLLHSMRRLRANAKLTLMQEILEGWLDGPVDSHVVVGFQDGNGTKLTLSLARRTRPGRLVEFGNLPPERVQIEHRPLRNGIGYIRLNLFLDPVIVMPEIESAVRDFRDTRGIVLDLRNNPGGLGVMAMGIAGWFVSQDGLRLGTMVSRDSSENFEINPRMEAYEGCLAILVNGGSASTTEILAQGLQDLKRANVFGTRTAGEALPSDIIELPNGDRLQYPEANYVSLNGRVLEGNGVQPDVVVNPTMQALLAGRDLVLEAASRWIEAQPTGCAAIHAKVAETK